jgi:hypothetical protein
MKTEISSSKESSFYFSGRRQCGQGLSSSIKNRFEWCLRARHNDGSRRLQAFVRAEAPHFHRRILGAAPSCILLLASVSTVDKERHGTMMAPRKRVERTGGESCRRNAFEFSLAIKLALLLPLQS